MDKLKKYWPIAVVLLAIVFVVGLVLVVRGRGGNEAPIDEEESVAEVPVEQRPVTMLVPRSDGHWMDLTVEDINVQGAATIEYEFTYTTTDGRSQGTGGSKPFKAGDDFTSEILIGTTSSGKFYYDEGVESGELTLKFRNDNGKLVGKLVTPWALRHEPESIQFEGFTYTLEEADDLYVVAMNTFGVPGTPPGTVNSGPIGFFASDEAAGTLTAASGSIYRWNEFEWSLIDNGASVEPGIFVTISQ